MSTSPKPKPRVFYGWYIVATCFFIGFFSVGARNAFGIFVIPMSEEFEWSRTTISLAAGLGFLVNGLTQPFLGHIFDKFGARRVVLTGLVVIGLATMTLSFTFHILFLIFMFSFVLSTSLSSASVTNTMALVSGWFVRRRATAVGIASAGTQVGGMFLVPFAMYLLQATGWRMTWAVLGLLTLTVATPMAFLFIRNHPAIMGLRPDGDLESEDGDLDNRRERRQGIYEVDQWKQSLQTAPIWQLTGAYVVCGITTGLISTHFVPLAIDRGVSPSLAATIFGLMTGLNALGGIVASMLSDHFRRKNILAMVYLIRGVAFMLLVLIPGTAGLWAFALVAGVSWLASVPITASLTADIYGTRSLGTISGVTFLFHQVGSFSMILLGGVFYDITGGYNLSFAVAGMFLFPAALLSFSIKEGKYSVRFGGTAAAPAPAPAGTGD